MEPPRAPDPEPPVKSNMIHLRKVMLELVETERSYVQDLLTLRNSYVEPIRMEGCFSPDQVEELFGSLTPLTEFQRDFLKALEDGLKVVPDIEKLKDKTQVKRMLFSLGGAFLYYSEHFKLYGAYCANYHKAQRVLEKAKKDGHFQKFLNTLNPSGQHSSTLESFLIKPIQRILKYPLLLRELCSVVDMDSEEGYHLSEALKAMNETASHINEMQKLYEIYGKHFDELMLEHKMDTDEPTDLSMGDLLAHGTVCWLNSARGPTDTHVFVFKKAVVLICKDFLKNRRRSDTIEGSFRYLIPSTEIQMHSSRETVAISEGDCEEQWEIIHVSPNRDSHAAVVFQLSSLSSMRMTLERAVRSVLRAQARERLCKAASLPDKPKGYQPFGGTRLSALRTRTARGGTAAPPSRRLQKQACKDSEPSSPAYGPLNTARSTEDSSSSSTGDAPIPGCSALSPFSPHASSAHDSPQVFASRDVPHNGLASKSCDSSPRSPPRSLMCQGFDVKMASKQCIVFDETPKVTWRCEDFRGTSSINTGIKRMAGCTIGQPRMERRAGRGDIWTDTSFFGTKAESESDRTCAEDERILRAMNSVVMELRWGDGFAGRARYDGQLRSEKLGTSIGLKRV